MTKEYLKILDTYAADPTKAKDFLCLSDGYGRPKPTRMAIYRLPLAESGQINSIGGRPSISI
jgi:hypothetical protein